ncbi:MAG: prepilin-type N-terminal cleavage/methylation domain-containing protein [Plesiomonas sp.]|uniref:prepilin-type N-terminal cleavage/methylation domain-containing protein n=1 Tax=Plesiomonas sp. TaxID=2486279 RepID=UPI003F39AAF4
MFLRKGYSLVELLIAMVIGSALILLVGDVYVKSSIAIKTLQDTRYLESEMNRVLSLITKDIKRAGYINFYKRNMVDGNHSTFYYQYENNGMIYKKSPFSVDATGGCILFFYDLDNNGCIGDNNITTNTSCSAFTSQASQNENNETFGYKFDIDNKNIDASMSFANSCDNKNWSSMFDGKRIKVTDFKIKNIKHTEVVLADQMSKAYIPSMDIEIKASMRSNTAIERVMSMGITLENLSYE